MTQVITHIWRAEWRADGAAFAWGSNNNNNNKGQLGDGTRTARSLPVRVHGQEILLRTTAEGAS